MFETRALVRGVKLFLYLIKHHTTRAYKGVELQLLSFVTSALDGGE